MEVEAKRKEVECEMKRLWAQVIWGLKVIFEDSIAMSRGECVGDCEMDKRSSLVCGKERRNRNVGRLRRRMEDGEWTMENERMVL